MKFVLIVVGAACAGALAMLALPPTVVRAASDGLRQVRLSDINPFRAIFDYEQQRIRQGMTPDELGIQTSTVKFVPVTLTPPPSLKLDLSRAYEAQAESQIHLNERRMQAMQAYTSNPSQWSGPPPN